MKAKLIEWIPFYGLLRYVKRYSNAKNMDNKQALYFAKFEAYHLAVTVLLISFLIKIIAA